MDCTLGSYKFDSEVEIVCFDTLRMKPCPKLKLSRSIFLMNLFIELEFIWLDGFIFLKPPRKEELSINLCFETSVYDVFLSVITA